jgi:hypothetical protein
LGIPEGDPPDYATITRIRLLDEGVDQHFRIGSLRVRRISAEKVGLGWHHPKTRLDLLTARMNLCDGFVNTIV